MLIVKYKTLAWLDLHTGNNVLYSIKGKLQNGTWVNIKFAEYPFFKTKKEAKEKIKEFKSEGYLETWIK